VGVEDDIRIRIVIAAVVMREKSVDADADIGIGVYRLVICEVRGDYGEGRE